MRNVWLFFIVSLVVLFCMAESNIADLHRTFMRTRAERNDWKRYYSDEDLIAEAVFFDVDHDGIEEVLLVKPDGRDKGASCWSFYSLDPEWRPKPHCVGDKYLYCNSNDLYVLSLQNACDSLVGIDAGVQIRTDGDCDIVTNATFIIGKTTDQKLATRFISGELLQMIKNPSFRKLERVSPEIYRGHSMKLCAQEKDRFVSKVQEIIAPGRDSYLVQKKDGHCSILNVESVQTNVLREIVRDANFQKIERIPPVN